MRILHVVPSFAPAWIYGGPVRAAYELCREQAKQGADVTVFTTNINGPADLPVPVDRTMNMEGFQVRYCRVQPPRSYSFSMSLARSLRSKVREFDIVHIHSLFNWPISPASFYCRQYEIPYIVRPCGMLDPVAVRKPYEDEWASLSSRIKKALYMGLVERRNLEGAAALHFTCRQEREDAQWLEIRAPGFVIPLGISPEEPTESRELLGLPGDKLVILFMSRIDRKKGLEVLIQALESINRDDFVLVVAGEGDPEYEATVRKRIDGSTIAARSIWFGPVRGARKWSLLRAADIFALPSYHENFGLAVAEALAAGVPVVVSRKVGISSEIESNRSGIVTECAPESVSGALRRLMDNPEDRKDMGRRARELASDAFSWPKIARQVLEIYHGVTTGRTPAQAFA